MPGKPPPPPPRPAAPKDAQKMLPTHSNHSIESLGLPAYAAPPPPPQIESPSLERLTLTGASSPLSSAIQTARALDESLHTNLHEIEAMKADLISRKSTATASIIEPPTPTPEPTPEPTPAVAKSTSRRLSHTDFSPPKKTPIPPSKVRKPKPPPPPLPPPPKPAPPPSPPPSPTWLSYYSASHQCCYYENVASGAVQWTPPPEGEGVEAGDEGEYEEEEEEEEYEEAQEEDQYEEQQYEEQQYEQEYEQGQYEEEQEERSSSSPHEQYSPIQQPSSPAAAASSSPPLTISPRSHAPSDMSSITHIPPPRPSPTSNPSRAAAPHYQKQLSPALQPSDATVTPYNTHHTTDNPTSQYDKAMRTKQETERRRQLQRHQQQAAELSSMKQPKVNRNSAKMVAKATMPIGDRAKEQAERKQAKLDKLRREKDEVEMASLSTKPVIHTGKNTYHRSDSISSEASMQVRRAEQSKRNELCMCGAFSPACYLPSCPPSCPPFLPCLPSPPL